jgi:hypothetical protein
VHVSYQETKSHSPDKIVVRAGLSNFSSPQLVVLATLGLRKWRQRGEQRATKLSYEVTQHLGIIIVIMEV